MLKDLAQRFWKIEEELDLFKGRIGDFEVWLLIRFEVFTKVCEDTKLYDVAHEHLAHKSFKEKLPLIINTIKHTFTNNPFVNAKPAKYFFFGHPRRKQLADGKWWDVYIDPLLEEFKLDYYFLEKSYAGKHLVPAKTPGIHYFSLRELYSKWRSFKKPYTFTTEDRAWLQRAEDAINNEYQINVKLAPLVSARLQLHTALLRFYDKILAKVKPEILFTVVAYGTDIAPLTQAAKRRKIPVVELQHGTINKYHLAYSFPNGRHDSPYLPDYIFSFGKFWSMHVDFAIDKSKILDTGYAFFTERTKKYLGKKPSANNRILFISQGSIGVELSKFAVSLATLKPGWHIDYKLHGGEQRTWQQKYTWLSSDKNITVIDNNAVDLYELISQATYVVGVSSTAVYEALAFGKRVFLVNLPSIEYMDELKGLDGIKWVSQPEEVAAALAEGPDSGTPVNGDLFFNSHWKELFLKNVNTVLGKSSIEKL